MANRTNQSDNQRTQHLDALGPRNVVFCHQCEYEWFEDEYGIVCPSCDGNVTEIVVPGVDDPRQFTQSEQPPLPPRPLDLWTTHAPDHEESDLEELTSNGPNNSSITFGTSQTSTPRSTTQTQNSNDHVTENESGNVLIGFQSMISNLLLSQLRRGAPVRPGPDNLLHEPTFQTSSFRISDSGGGNPFVGGRFIFTNIFTPTETSLHPRSTNESDSGESHQVEDIITTFANIIASSVSDINANPNQNDDNTPRPNGFQAMFSTSFRPGAGRFGDAVYSQEALDQILTALMEESTMSNAPSPASPEAIAALPRVKLDYKLLGPEGKGECSICMEELKIGDEVMVLSCNHWFDEACATAWLKEHNTCPICRKGIDEENVSSKSQSPQTSQSNSTTSSSGDRSHRQRNTRTRSSQEQRTRNEERLSSLRQVAGIRLPEVMSGQTRSQESDNHPTSMPGSFPEESRDCMENTSSSRPSSSITRSLTGNNGNSRLNNAFRHFRGIQDRMNNNRRNN